MVRPRFSIARLILFVAAVGVGLAAVRSATLAWAFAAEFVTVSFLLASILGVLFHKGPDRAFWIGFLVFGWSFAGLLFVLPSLIETPQEGLPVTTIRSALSDLSDWIHPFDIDKQYESAEARSTANDDARRVEIACTRICEMIFILCTAAFGGVLGRFFASRNASRAAP